jgi:AbrB family looped-hinge helix DNA binding protein
MNGGDHWMMSIFERFHNCNCRRKLKSDVPQHDDLTYFFIDVRLQAMNPTAKTDTVQFTTKGQIVIPRWLRKDFEIDEGTRAVVYKHNDHIVLKPITAQHYRRLRGSLKGTKAMDVFMSERKREREL